MAAATAPLWAPGYYDYYPSYSYGPAYGYAAPPDSVVAQGSGDVAYCEARFRSYDPHRAPTSALMGCGTPALRRVVQSCIEVVDDQIRRRAAWIVSIITELWGGIIIDWCTPINHLSAKTSTLCLPRPYAGATCALASPNTGAAGCTRWPEPLAHEPPDCIVTLTVPAGVTRPDTAAGVSPALVTMPLLMATG